MNFDSMIDREEGREHKAYRDTGDIWTIGKGHTGLEVHEGLVWDDAQIEFAYQLDKSSAWQGCVDNFMPWFELMNDARQAVLWSMVFQMGLAGTLKFVNTLGAIRDQRYDHAATLMLASLWAKQTPQRVGRLSRQIATGEWQ
jgi:GH24 family phage-related lysozyme (muramidase)